MVKKTTSIICDETIWWDFKLICMKNHIELGGQLEEMIKEFNQKNGGK